MSVTNAPDDEAETTTKRLCRLAVEEGRQQIEDDGELRVSELSEWVADTDAFPDAVAWHVGVIEDSDVYTMDHVGDCGEPTLRDELRRLAASALVDLAVDRLEERGTYDPERHPIR